MAIVNDTSQNQPKPVQPVTASTPANEIELNWKQKLIGYVVDKKLGAPAVQEKVQAGWGKVEGLKTYLVGLSMIVTSLIALMDQIKLLLADGLQYADIIVLSKSEATYTLLIGVGMMTGRSAINKMAEKLKQG